jgi:two-component system nitrogen regulation response regulator GlnG
VVGRNTARLERRVIAQALRRTGGNKAKAARLLQVDYKTLHSKVKEYGIPIEGEQLHA